MSSDIAENKNYGKVCVLGWGMTGQAVAEYLSPLIGEKVEELTLYTGRAKADSITEEKLKKAGVACYAAMRKDARIYDEIDCTVPLLIAVGGEMRGLSASVRREITNNIYIPYANDFRNALNAASAAAVLSYEAARQRRKKGM